MLGLSDGERISMIRSAVLTQYTRVTDGQMHGRTDRRTDGIGMAYTHYSIYAVARKNYRQFLQIWGKFGARGQDSGPSEHTPIEVYNYIQ